VVLNWRFLGGRGAHGFDGCAVHLRTWWATCGQGLSKIGFWAVANSCSIFVDIHS